MIKEAKSIGKLIVFEGPDGIGKTTLANRLVSELKTLGYICTYFSFPGREPGTLGNHVYELHHNKKKFNLETISAESLQLLHIAAHIDCISNRIIPTLQSGVNVILDRFWWSTVVYGACQGLSETYLKDILNIEEHKWQNILPTILFLIKRSLPINISADDGWLKIRERYEKLAKTEKGTYPIQPINNECELETTLATIINYLIKNVFMSNNENQSFNNRYCFTKIDPAKPTLVFDTYWKFAAERQNIFFKRLNTTTGPWTQDPILQEYKFTNAYRASDRVSQYLIRNIINEGDKSIEEMFFRVILFKTFNKIETWEYLKEKIDVPRYSEFAIKMYDRLLTQVLKDGKSIYSAAYIMPTGGASGVSKYKHQMHLELIDKMMKSEMPTRICEAKSMRSAFEILRGYPYIGDFLAYQYITDFNYTPYLNFTEMEFVMPGPGARDGIKKCFSSLGGLNEAEVIKMVTDRQEEEINSRGIKFKKIWGRPLQLIDCQNLFCEVDKYARIKHPEYSGNTGRTRIKQKFKPKNIPIELLYPEKWGINQFLSLQSEET